MLGQYGLLLYGDGPYVMMPVSLRIVCAVYVFGVSGAEISSEKKGFIELYRSIIQ